MRVDNLFELCQRSPGCDSIAHHFARSVPCRRHRPQNQHLDAKRRGHVDEIGRPGAPKNVDCLYHFECIAARFSQWTIHRGEKRNDRASVARAKIDHRPRHLQLVLEIRQERSRAALDVQHQSRQRLRDLFAHDACCNERNHLHRRSRVAERVHLPIGGNDLVGLTQHRAPDSRHLSLCFVERQRGSESRNRLQFVQRSTSVPQSAP